MSRTLLSALVSRPRLGGGLLLALCLLLFLPGFFSVPPIDRDEARFAQSAKQMIEAGDPIDIRLQGEPRHKKPVGIYWLQAAVVAAIGPDVREAIWAYRIPSLIGAIIAVFVTAAIGRRLFSAEAGWLAACMMGGCAVLLIEARLAKTDAMLLATILAAQLVLARAYLGKAALPEDRRWALLFWAALATGILIKGPIILLVVGGTIFWILIFERRARWLLRLHWPIGVPLFLAIALPWFIAITLVTDGAFFNEAIGRDLLDKAASGQESHGAPPGTFLLAFWGTFWPWSLFAALAIPWIWSRRKEPAVRFCVAWIVPAWIVFEVTPTKLAHYVMPTYPAIAILAAAALIDGYGGTRRVSRGPWFWVPAIGWGGITAAVCIGSAGISAMFGRGIMPAGIVGGLLGLLIGCVALWALRRQRLGLVAASCAGLVAVLVLAMYGSVFPALDRLWISPRIAAAVDAHETCPAQPVALAGYREPSAVFLLGTETRLVKGAEAALHLMEEPCRLAAVEAAHVPDFEAALAAQGGLARPLSVVDGFNLNGGDELSITLFALQPEG